MTNDPAYRSVSYALKRAVHDYTAGMRNLNTPLRPDQLALLDDFTHTTMGHITEDIVLDMNRARIKAP